MITLIEKMAANDPSRLSFLSGAQLFSTLIIPDESDDSYFSRVFFGRYFPSYELPWALE